MTEPTDRDLILASRRKRRTGAPRSELRLWLDANLDDLNANPPDWSALVARLNGRGMRDAFGRKLISRSVARAFSRANAERHGPKPPAGARPRAISQERTPHPFQIRPINSPKETP